MKFLRLARSLRVMPRRAVRLAALLALTATAMAACGTDTTSQTPPSSNGGATPTLSLMGCPAPTGSSGGGLVGIGGTVEAFASVHGSPTSGANGYGSAPGGDEFAIECPSGADVVEFITFNPPEGVVSEAQALDELAANKLVPPDASKVSDATPQPCKTIIFHSTQLAAVGPGAVPSGNYLVELMRPTSDPGNYDAAKVGSAWITVDTAGGC